MTIQTLTSFVKVRGTAAERTAVNLSDIPQYQEIEFFETDTDATYRGSRDGWVQTRVGGTALVSHGTHLPGARNETSSTIDYLRAFPTGTATRCDTGTTETVITASPAVILAIIGNDANAGYSSLRNAATIGGASTPVALPNVADGASLNMHGMVFDTGITIQGELAAHDVTVVWAAL